MLDEICIISGGRGSRLGKMGEEIPKAFLRINNESLIRRSINFCKKYKPQKTKLILSAYYKSNISKQEIPKNVIIKWEENPKGIGVCLLEEILSTNKSKLILFGDVFHSHEFDFNNLQENSIYFGVVKHQNGNPQKECQITFDAQYNILKVSDKTEFKISDWCWNGSLWIQNLHLDVLSKIKSIKHSNLNINILLNEILLIQNNNFKMRAHLQEGDFFNVNTLEELNHCRLEVDKLNCRLEIPLVSPLKLRGG